MWKYLLGLLVLIAVGVALYRPAARYWAERNKPEFRTSSVAKRTVTYTVEATGEIKPVLSVTVGSFVSGPIEKLHVDFNDRVTKGQLLAEIDTRIYDAAVARDRAALLTREAEVLRVEAQLQQAKNDEQRSIALRAESTDYISQAEIDQFHFARVSLEAQLSVAEAAVSQAEANLNNSLANLDFTKIRSEFDGIVIDRMIDPGQTLASQFQAPELFIVAPRMEEEMHVFASIDEADIGLIRRAQEAGQSVEFTVDAYPDDTFQGEIQQIRFSPTEVQNVVTYPVVVSAANPELKLLPGMTANLSFKIEEKADVICIPNSALRFYPENAQLVRESDRSLLEGFNDQEGEEDDDDAADGETKSKTSKRHVWIKSAEGLRAIEVETGISDNRYTEMVAGEVTAGQELVTDVKK